MKIYLSILMFFSTTIALAQNAVRCQWEMNKIYESLNKPKLETPNAYKFITEDGSVMNYAAFNELTEKKKAEVTPKLSRRQKGNELLTHIPVIICTSDDTDCIEKAKKSYKLAQQMKALTEEAKKINAQAYLKNITTDKLKYNKLTEVEKIVLNNQITEINNTIIESPLKKMLDDFSDIWGKSIAIATYKDISEGRFYTFDELQIKLEDQLLGLGYVNIVNNQTRSPFNRDIGKNAVSANIFTEVKDKTGKNYRLNLNFDDRCNPAKEVSLYFGDSKDPFKNNCNFVVPPTYGRTLLSFPRVRETALSKYTISTKLADCEDQRQMSEALLNTFAESQLVPDIHAGKAAPTRAKEKLGTFLNIAK